MKFLLDRIKSKYLLISYNNEGLLTFSQLKELFQKYGSIKIYEFPYKPYQSQKKAIPKTITSELINLTDQQFEADIDLKMGLGIIEAKPQKLALR